MRKKRRRKRKKKEEKERKRERERERISSLVNASSWDDQPRVCDCAVGERGRQVAPGRSPVAGPPISPYGIVSLLMPCADASLTCVMLWRRLVHSKVLPWWRQVQVIVQSP